VPGSRKPLVIGAAIAAAVVVIVIAAGWGVELDQRRAAKRAPGHGPEDAIVDGQHRITIDSAGIVNGTGGMSPLAAAVVRQTVLGALEKPRTLGAGDSLATMTPQRAADLADSGRTRDSAAHLYLGALDERARRPAAAVVEFRALVELNPSSMIAQRLLGRARHADSSQTRGAPAP
jgi:hypothetical protein